MSHFSSSALSVVSTEKRCSRCEEYKPFDAFNLLKKAKDGLQNNCRECQKAFRALNSEQSKVWRSGYEKANRERITEKNRAYRLANPDKIQATQKKYKQANRERVAASHAAYKRANPEKVKVYDHKQRAKRRKAEGSYTATEWKAKLELYKGRCHWCNEVICGVVHADHAIALARGGTNYISNIVPSCVSCNTRKQAKMPWEFNGRLL